MSIHEDLKTKITGKQDVFMAFSALTPLNDLSRIVIISGFQIGERLRRKHQKNTTSMYRRNMPPPRHPSKRGTSRPTAERLLRAFDKIFWTSVMGSDGEHLHVTPLSEVQVDILYLLGFSAEVYTRLCNPVFKYGKGQGKALVTC